LVGLGLAGEVEAATFYLAVTMVPALVVGFAISRVLHRRVPHHQIRAGVLVVSGLSAVVVLVRSLPAL
ncbi:MAG TPA: sulfite exporter TauE/SafE family protein, partial [Nocardioidaceae bacterium]